MLHRIAHRLGWNRGRVHTWSGADGVLMVGFRCSGCGVISYAEPLDPIIDNLLEAEEARVARMLAPRSPAAPEEQEVKRG